MSDIIVAPNGMLRFIYDDDIASMLQDIGTLSIARASYVEPGLEGKWYVDLAPVGGPVYGPYNTRAEALSEEVNWIKNHAIPIPQIPR